MKVIAIDPGYERVGIAILQKNIRSEILLFSECFQTPATMDFNERLSLIGEEVRKLIQTYKPDAMAIESLFFSKNTRTALGVSEARGVIMFQASDQKIPIFEYTPNQIKVAVTGYGRATKKDIFSMVSRLIKIGEGVKKDDEIDAIATGLTFFASYKNIKA